MKRMIGAIVIAIAAAAFVVAALVAHTTTPKTVVQQVVPAAAPQHTASTQAPLLMSGSPEPAWIGGALKGPTPPPCIPPECHTTP